MNYPRLARLKTHTDFVDHLRSADIEMPSDATVASGKDSPLASPIETKGRKIGNRFCILPMEGWDGTKQGKPTDLTRRRWQNFGRSGAKWIWGGEAVAVRHDGRANPNQLLLVEENLSDIEALRETLVQTHAENFGDTSDLCIGLQLTHSGRYARPNQKKVPEPRIVQRNPVLDRRVNVSDDAAVFSDDELNRLVDDFILAARRAEQLGFDFVDVKHCHGYLGHELLSGVDRQGIYGGSFENRTRFLRNIVEGIASETNSLDVGVRLSVFDFLPHHTGAEGIGEPEPGADPRLLFGATHDGMGIDFNEPHRLLDLMKELGIRWVCTTAGSPYSTPHIQRPAYFPPSDGYSPPEDPLAGVARQIRSVGELKRRHPELVFVGSGYSYLQEYLPHVGQAVVSRNMADSIGVGRMVLSYPELPADVLEGRSWQRKKVCRTFSDCTTAPRNGLVSGCYPLDPFYKQRQDFTELQQLKKNDSEPSVGAT